jgi:hypothetical protein
MPMPATHTAHTDFPLKDFQELFDFDVPRQERVLDMSLNTQCV